MIGRDGFGAEQAAGLFHFGGIDITYQQSRTLAMQQFRQRKTHITCPLDGDDLVLQIRVAVAMKGGGLDAGQYTQCCHG